MQPWEYFFPAYVTVKLIFSVFAGYLAWEQFDSHLSQEAWFQLTEALMLMRWLDCRSQNSLIHKGLESSACSGCREHQGVGWALFSCGECGWDCVYQVGYTILTGTLQICLVLLCEGEEIIFLVKMMTVIWAICVQSCPRVCDDAVSVYFFFFLFFLTRSILNGPTLHQFVFDICACMLRTDKHVS